MAFGARRVPATNYMQPKTNNTQLKITRFFQKKNGEEIEIVLKRDLENKLLSLTNQIIRQLTSTLNDVRSFQLFCYFSLCPSLSLSTFLVQSWVLQDRKTSRQVHHSNLQGRTDSLCHPRSKSFPKVVGDGWSVALHSSLSWLLWGSITRSAFYTPSCYRSTKNPRHKLVCWFFAGGFTFCQKKKTFTSRSCSRFSLIPVLKLINSKWQKCKLEKR